jgi:excisionase family DNA binding protein
MPNARLPFDPPMTCGAQQGRVTLNIYQAMARCQVSRRTIYNWLHAGKLQYVRTAGGSVRIFEDSLWRRTS